MYMCVYVCVYVCVSKRPYVTTVTRTCVSPRVKSTEPWGTGSTPSSMLMGRTSVGPRPVNVCVCVCM